MKTEDIYLKVVITVIAIIILLGLREFSRIMIRNHANK